LIGTDSEILPTSEAEAWRLADLIRATMAPPDEDARMLIRALLHAPIDMAKNDAERRNAAKRVEFSKALCRTLVGDALADDLGVERTSWNGAVGVLKRIVAVADVLRGRVAAVDRTAISTGTRYWDRVVEVGLEGATAEFGLPEKLGG
jgi:hypothetical protein